MSEPVKKASPMMVIIAFATVYIVWGSTYFFIAIAIRHFPPMILGALRFLLAGGLMMGWCLFRGEKLGNWKQIKPALITGLLLLLVGNGGVIWAEKWLPSSLVAVLISSSPFWFVILDVPKWRENLTNRSIITGLIFGFIGVTLMFGEKIVEAITATGYSNEILGLIILLIATVSWAAGSLYSKHNSTGSSTVNTAWQMSVAGVAFLLISFFSDEWRGFEWGTVTSTSWFALFYLTLLGSVAAYSAYVWLLKVRPAAQVSTYAYVNPVIAVLLGVFFAGEHMSFLQVSGLLVILISVLLINLAKKKNSEMAK
jgi:drug/metabolite transporter (DMT)-like permease